MGLSLNEECFVDVTNIAFFLRVSKTVAAPKTKKNRALNINCKFWPKNGIKSI